MASNARLDGPASSSSMRPRIKNVNLDPFVNQRMVQVAYICTFGSSLSLECDNQQGLMFHPSRDDRMGSSFRPPLSMSTSGTDNGFCGGASF